MSSTTRCTLAAQSANRRPSAVAGSIGSYAARGARAIAIESDEERIALIEAKAGAIYTPSRVDTLDLDEETALHVGRLPPLHRDPFDRMLVSQAIVHGLTILTPDPLITQYPGRTAW